MLLMRVRFNHMSEKYYIISNKQKKEIEIPVHASDVLADLLDLSLFLVEGRRGILSRQYNTIRCLPLSIIQTC